MSHNRVWNKRNVTQAFLAQLADAIYVGRPSWWGNPYPIVDGDRDESIRKYIRHLENNPGLVIDARRELKGKHLLCWCAPERCHGDVLAFVADGMIPELAGAIVLGEMTEQEALDLEKEDEG